MIVTRKGVIIDKKHLSQTQLNKLRSDLTVHVSNQQLIQLFGISLTPQTFNIYLESPNKICIPKYYALHKAGFQPTETRNHTLVVTCPNLQFMGKLNADKKQPEAIEAALKACNMYGGGILSLPTGYGKTVVAINIMCQMKLKTLIVVHKEFLLNQWEERIKQFAPLAKVGLIRQNKLQCHGKDVVIGMLQSLVSKEYDPNILAEFGLVIFDEVHHLSAPTFSQCLFNLCAPNIIGLSATPARKDGLEWVLESFIGPVFFQVSRQDQAHVQVVKVPYSLDIDSDLGGDLPRLPNGRCYDATKITTYISFHHQRNVFIANLLNSIMSEHGRKVLVLCDRREHCFIIKELVDSICNNNHVTSLYIGGMKQTHLKQSEKSDCIIATYSFANEGLDIPGLNVLVFATPKGDIIQSAGRVLRDGGGGNITQSPIIYDICDNHKYFQNKFKIRQAFYNKAGFAIHNYSSELPTLNQSSNSSVFAFQDET